MTQFKEGQTIIMKEDCSGAIKGKKYILRYGSKFKDFKCNLYAWDKEIDDFGCSCQEKWQLVEKTLYDLEVGDEVVDPNNDERTILSRTGSEENPVLDVSNSVTKDEYRFTMTAKQMEREYWKAKQPTLPEYTKEEEKIEEVIEKYKEKFCHHNMILNDDDIFSFLRQTLREWNKK